MTSLFVLQIVITLFFAVLFLQSGIDKVMDWKGNLEFISGHFANSPLKKQTPMLLGVITLTEVGAGLACLVGAILIAIGQGTVVAQWALVLCALNILMLFIGQRLAKDYAGAATLASYFGVTIVAYCVVGSVWTVNR